MNLKLSRFALLSSLFVASLLDAQMPSTQDLPLMPWPASLSRAAGSIPIDNSFTVSLEGEGAKDERVLASVNRLFGRLARQTGLPLTAHVVPAASNATLRIVIEARDHAAPQRLGDNEHYSLEAAGSQIAIAADAPLGAVHALDTFLQLVQQSAPAEQRAGFSVPAISIHDEPRFAWRGLSLDVARHFMPVPVVKRTLDGMSAVKLNVLHLHLSDDEGFRVESKKFPRLQEYGSDGLFYTQAEIRGLISYARDRGLRIVPEFDIPGHATSWLVGYPKLGARSGSFEITRHFDTSTDLIDPTLESTYVFLDSFIGEMAGLFPDEYFHIGGDEVNPKQWNDSERIRAFMRVHRLADAKALHTYFNQRLLKIITKHGKHMEGWDEILQPDLPKSILVQSWRGQPSLWQGAKEGFRGILSAGYYLDLMYPASYHYSIDPMKAPGNAPGHGGEAEPDDPKNAKPGTPADLSTEQSKLILGGEAAMWVELSTPENIDAKLWPRLAAIAERFWSPESVTDVESMYRRLYVTNDWLAWSGLTQRTNLELMRQRLAGALPFEPLDTFAQTIEPVKGYARNAETYTPSTSLNRLVDAIPPESEAARQFRIEVDQFVLAPGDRSKSDGLRRRLEGWSHSAEAIRSMCNQNSMMAENLPVAEAIANLSQAGAQALSYLDGSAAAPSGWKQQTQTALVPFVYKRIGDLVIPIAPAVARLVDAVGSTPQ